MVLKVNEFEPHLKQLQFFEALKGDWDYYCFLASRQSGKSEGAFQLLYDATINVEGTVVYVAPEIKHALQLGWDTMLEMFGGKESDGGLIIHHDKNSHIMKVRNIYGTETKLYFFGWNGGRVDAIRGKSIDFIVVDEVDMCNDFTQGLKEVIEPTFTTTLGKGIFISTPKNFGNMYWLKQQSEKFPDRYFFLTATYLDNPYANIQLVEDAKREAEENGTLDSWKQEYLCEFTMAHGAIFDTFDPDVHVLGNKTIKADDPDEVKIQKQLQIQSEEVATIESTFKTKVAGVDFGYGENGITAILLGGFDHANRLIITREEYSNIVSPRLIAEKIMAYDPDICFADPADPWRVNELSEYGVPIEEFHKKGGFVVNGCERIRSMFQRGGLFIHADCENLIIEIGSATWAENKHLVSATPKPDQSVADHARDTLAYIAMNSAESEYHIQAMRERNFFVKRKKENIIQ